ncbi:hypothetical protein K435DRAFT_865327 [Dendrothele bispora CBS 962.96]|uniref:Uncharacterized protein n=1 Tax=Dendrothele bispora (strain CBS 962.96) TaxID=1314807 RepID=A0A4V4HE38_DENBC|nr:hypothetical protein K435DRAFT_865327 [Dendrothele bispora CBS 962.96]
MATFYCPHTTSHIDITVSMCALTLKILLSTCRHSGKRHPTVTLQDDEPNTQLITPMLSPSPPPDLPDFLGATVDSRSPYFVLTQEFVSTLDTSFSTGPTFSPPLTLLVDSRALTVPIDFVLSVSKLSGKHLVGQDFIDAS